MMNDVTIHKRNELTRGSDDYSLNAKRCLNAIYYIVQKNNLYKKDYFLLSFATLKKMMNLEKNEDYIERIKSAFLELEQPMQLNNFYHPILKETFNWYSMSFLDEAGFRKENNNQTSAVVRVNPVIKHLMQLDGNFTKLDLIYHMNKFRTKYAMKLYEFLKSFEDYQYIQLSQQHTMKLLGINEDDITNKHYSKLKVLIDRQLKEIIKKTDLKEIKREDSKELSKSKIYKIYIDPKSKKVPKVIDIEQSINDIIKRF